MPCYHPLQAWQSRQVNKNGNHYAVFDKKHGWLDKPINFPCGNCIGCRLERSRQWAVRCLHEASLHEDNCFITLTYEELPENGSLNKGPKSDYTLFMKRLRKNTGAKIRYFQCGEYGEKFQRPHHHALLFGYDFPDKQPWKIANKEMLYTSQILQDAWKHGFCSIGEVTFKSAAYVARYITKKVNGELADKTLHYWNIDYDTGEANERIPEYITMSRGDGKTTRGIGFEWYKKFGRETFHHDTVVVGGKTQKPPDYYFNKFKEDDPEKHYRVKRKRLREAQKSPDNTPRRLRDREEVREAAAAYLIRSYESEN